MIRDPVLRFAAQLLRLLVLIIILTMLVPRIFLAFVDLYNVLLKNGDRVPSGNPMKVDAPLQKKDLLVPPWN